MSGDITAELDSGENLPIILDCIMKIRYNRVFSTIDLQMRQQLADSYNFKAQTMNKLFGLSLQYISTSSN